jgi:hypothetical protein
MSSSRVVGLILAFSIAGCTDETALWWHRRPGSVVDEVRVTPDSTEVDPGATFRFTAEVRGGSGIDRSVRWLVEPDPGGFEVGSIDPDGTYHAPSTCLATPARVRAVSVHDPSKEGTATVVLPPHGVAVSPASAEAMLGGAVTFSAVVSGVVDTAVQWRALYGTVDGSGHYHAPSEAWTAEDTVVARSVASGVEASAKVSLRLRTPVVDPITGPAAAGDTLTLTGSSLMPSLGGDAHVIFPAEGGFTIPVLATPASVGAITVTVPSGASSGPLTVEVSSAPLGKVLSNAVTFQRAPRLRLHAARSDLSAGETVRLETAFLGAPGPAPLTWEADLGTLSGDLFTAPEDIRDTTFANVRACISGTTRCAGLTLAIHPFRVDPSPAVTPAGGVLDLVASVGGAPVPAEFSMLAGVGHVTSEGRYTAGTGTDAGQAWIAVEGGGEIAAVQVGVTGVAPGLLARVVDHVDHNVVDALIGAPRGTYAEALAVGGGRAYVSASHPSVLHGSRSYFWIDVYDVADPLRPEWLGAVESVTRPSDMFVAHGRLYAWSDSDWTAAFARTLAVYDLSGSLPALVALELSKPPPGLTRWGPPVSDGERLFVFGDVGDESTVLPVRVHVLADGALATPRTVLLPLPPEAGSGARIDGVTARGERAWAVYWTVANERKLATWDLASDPPTFLGAVDGAGYSLGVSGDTLVADAAYATVLYDVRGELPAVAGVLPFGARLAGAYGSRLLLQGDQSGMHVVDASEPAAPRAVSTLYVGLESRGSIGFAGNLLYSADGLAGIGIYDARFDGGPLLRSRFGFPPPTGGTAEVIDVVVREGHLYATGQTQFLGPFLAVWDLSTSPPTYAWQAPLVAPGYALAVAGDRLVVGTPENLQVWSLEDPAAPSWIASVPLDVNCVRVDGPIAWVGTVSGDLVSVDLYAPGGPSERGRVALGAVPFSIEPVSSGTLVVALASGAAGDLVVVDASSPVAPVVVAAAQIGFPVYDVAVQGVTGLLATAGGLMTVDLADPAFPTPLVLLPIPGVYPFGDRYQTVPAYVVAVHDGIAWVGTGYANGALHGYDVRNPRWPCEVARAALASQIDAFVFALAFDGPRGFAVGASYGEGMAELDLSLPVNVVMTLQAHPSLQR